MAKITPTEQITKITKDHPLSKSEDILQSNIEILKSLFPTIVKEGKIDIKELEALLSDEIETGDEYYRFTWAGKSDARKEANKPSTATLRPCKDESKNWDTTENIFIEGDNLEVLKLLQKSYPSQIKMIYIDPPYNTGKDFVYKDNYADNLGNYLALTGQVDKEGRRTSTNTESDGRYHSNWLNMMYPRLKLARNILKDDGVIYISIDDNEVHNLRKICDEIFGEENFVANIVWQKKYSPQNDAKWFSNMHDHIICYAKKKDFWRPTLLLRTAEQNARYTNPDNDSRGVWKSTDFSVKTYSKNYDYPVTTPSGRIVNPPTSRCWRTSKENFENLVLDNRIWFGQNGDSVPSVKKFLTEVKQGVTPSTMLFREDVGDNQEAANEIRDLFKIPPFDTPKPTRLISRLIHLGTDENDIVLDFFAGSGTTAHSVFVLNSTDGAKRKFICVQLPELTDKPTDDNKTTYKNISQITVERIRRAGDKIAEELKRKIAVEQKKKLTELSLEIEEDGLISSEELLKSLDIGFKAFKLDTSNINGWDGSVSNFERNLLNSETNIKLDRTEEDVLFEVLLKYGLNLTVPIEEKIVDECKVYNVGLGALFVCLADNITIKVAEEIGKWKEEVNPTSCRVLFKDNGFKDDVSKTNSIQILKRFSIQEINSL